MQEMKGTVENAEEQEALLKSFWLYPLIQGGIITALGLILLIFPKSGLIFLSVMIGLYILFLGIGQTVLAFRLSDLQANWWYLLIRGILLILAGVLVLWFPVSFAKLGMGIPLVLAGGFLIINGIQDLFSRNLPDSGRQHRSGSIMMVVLGALLCFAPVFSALMLFRIIGAASLAGGVMLIVKALMNRRHI